MKNKRRKVFIILGILIIYFIFLSLGLGRYKICPSTILYLIKAKMLGISVQENLLMANTAFWIIRVPRTIMAAAVGAVLGVSGTVFQGVFRNPLVSTDVLGVSTAASFGAGIAIIFSTCTSIYFIQFSAFIFAILGVIFAIGIGTKSKSNSITTLVLSGIVVSSIFSAGNSILKYIADPYTELPAITFWSMGAFNKVTWETLVECLPIFLICIIIIYILRWYIDLLSLDEEEAMSLGVNVKKIRIVLIMFSTLMTAVAISYCGIIGWVSLIIPHIGRFLVGPENKNLIPFSILFGAVFTLVMDIIARNLMPGEIPISILTSMVGAPFLGYLLIRYNKSF